MGQDSSIAFEIFNDQQDFEAQIFFNFRWFFPCCHGIAVTTNYDHIKRYLNLNAF